MKYRADNDLKERLNSRNHFSGTIRHGENIGKSADDLVAMWDEAHSEDPVK